LQHGSRSCRGCFFRCELHGKHHEERSLLID
jgi:hypothetical protein